jgi:Ca2+-binding EF-hand superfamily protein
MLFEGPDHSLRACVRGKIYAWTQENWQEVGEAPSSLEVFDDGVLLRQMPEIIPRASLSRLTNGASAPELCLLQEWPSAYSTRYPGGSRRQETNSAPIPKPLWKIPTEFPLGTASAALRQSDLYLLVDHSEVRNIADDQHVIVKQAVVGKNEYDAELLCFSHGLETPQKLFLKFDASDGCPPLAGVDPRASQLSSARSPAWILFAGKLLCFGVEGPRLGCQAGVWTVPFSELEPAIAAEKQSQLSALAREKALAMAAEEARRKNLEQRRADLIAKYDRNHNGAIDPEEKEAALDDPAFIESELEAIDANHNGRLEAAELAWFDANQNKILEPKEQAGIEITQHLLAAKLLKEFDANGDGLLDRAEFDALSASGWESRVPFIRNPLFPDENRDGHVDLPELEKFLKQQTRQGLRLRGMPMEALSYQIKTNADGSIDQHQLFKTAVESYWHHPGGNTNGPPFKVDSASPDGSRQRNP